MERIEIRQKKKKRKKVAAWRMKEKEKGKEKKERSGLYEAGSRPSLQECPKKNNENRLKMRKSCFSAWFERYIRTLKTRNERIRRVLRLN